MTNSKLIYQRKWLKTKLGRATNLLSSYDTKDKKYGRGKGNLTPQWIVDNIFSKPCVHCGESDWTKIGCNRIDNSKPHTKDNVEPCCWECNRKLWNQEATKRIYQYNLKGELIAIYESIKEAVKQTGFNKSTIYSACQGNNKTSNGYIWSYNEEKIEPIEINTKQVYQYTLDGELVGVYESTMEATRQTGFDQGAIWGCCNGKRKTHKGYRWSYVPL